MVVPLHSRYSTDDWATPEAFYAMLDAEFHFTDDPCELKGIYGINGLEREWGTSVFVNPPYSKPAPWILKAIAESKRGKVVVMLPKSDTSTNWFHDLVLPNAEIRWIKGRLRYSGMGRAPFPSMIAIFGKSNPNPEKFLDASGC